MLDWFFIRHNPYAVSGLARNSKTGQSLRGELCVSDGQLTLTSRFGSVALPIKGLTIQRNRWLGGPIRFSHANQPGWSVQTSSDRILHDPQFGGDGRLASLYRVHFKYTRQTVKLGLFAALLVFIFVPSVRMTACGYATALIPPKDDVYLGEELYAATIRPQLKLVDDPVVTGNVRQVLNRLVESLPPEDRPFHFQVDVALDPTVNAFALPGGHIVVQSGLLLDTRDIDELAGVLGHEMAHVTQRHAMRRFVEVAGFWILVQQLLGDSRMGRVAARYSGELTAMKFSRDDESQADHFGWTYVRRAHLNSGGLERFFTRLGVTHHDNETGDVEYLLRSHPLSTERAAALHALARCDNVDAKFQPLDIDYAVLKARVRQLQEAQFPPKQPTHAEKPQP